MTVVQEYQGAAHELPEEAFLGQLVFFTVSENDVSLEDMRREVIARSLRADLLPERIRPIDAFKKSVGDVAVRFRTTSTHRHALLVRPVGQDADTSYRNVVFERAEYAAGRRRSLGYDTLVSTVYDRGTRQKDGTIVDDKINITVHDVVGYTFLPEEQAWVDEHIGPNGEKIQESYHRWLKKLDHNAVRSFLREYLYKLDAMQVKRNGGVYFVPQEHAEELRRLVDLMDAVGSTVHLVPLLDIVDQRQMLGRSLIDETSDDVASMTARVADILKNPDRTITQGTYDEWVNKGSMLVQKIELYKKMLDENLDAATFQAEVLKSQVLRLADRIKVPKGRK